MSDPTDLDAAALSAALEAGMLGPVEVMEATLDRIERLNPAINTIVSLRPREELLAEARAAMSSVAATPSGASRPGG